MHEDEERGFSWIELRTRVSLADRGFMLSSYYVEPDGEGGQGESSLVTRHITVQGGFDLSLQGAVLCVSGGQLGDSLSAAVTEAQFRTDPAFIDSIDEGDFLAPFGASYAPSGETAVTPGLLASLDGGGQHQFVRIAGNGVDVTIPCDGTEVDRVALEGGKEYRLTFFDILSSMWCSENAYAAAKAKRLVTVTPSAQMTVKAGSLAPGSSDSFAEAAVSEDGEAEAKTYAMGEEVTLLAGRRYSVEFTPVSLKAGAQNKWQRFAMDVALGDGFAIGFRNVSLGAGVQILDVIPTFETALGRKYTQRMTYLEDADAWIPEDTPFKAARLTGVLVAFAFAEEQRQGEG